VPGQRALVVFLGFPTVALLGIVALAITGFIAVAALVKKNLQRAISAAVFPLAFLIVATNYGAAIRICSTAADYLQFYVGYPYFAHAVRGLDAEKGPRIAVFTMDGFISMRSGVAFDETDEIRLPAGKQSDVWRARVVHTELSGDEWVAQRIAGHYYRWWSY